MELSLQTLLILPMALGLLGFVEPCTIGAHLLFLETQNRRAVPQRAAAIAVFIIVRAVMAGLFGALVAFAGARLIGLQTGLWLVFGAIYLTLGLAFMFARARAFKQPLDLAPAAWRQAQNPAIMGAAFGFNIPACAAPILFSLLTLSATTGTALTGFAMMFVFGLFLSAPLLLFVIIPGLAPRLETLAQALKARSWLLGVIFVALGLWSIWFGLYVDPANWAG